MTRFATFHDAYVELLSQLYCRPDYNNAARGFSSKEQLGVTFLLRDPVQRTPFVASRKLNIIFNFAETLWYLSGRDDQEYLTYYAPRLSRFTGGQARLTGTAYGVKIFGKDGRIDQWQSVITQLREDPDSKRAVIQIFDSTELSIPENPDVSCTLGIQYLLRENALHSIGFMRANDVYRGLVSDIFSFTMLQELMANQLDVEVGSYTHMVGSLHLYDKDRDAAARVLTDVKTHPRATFVFPSLPRGDNKNYISEVLWYEERLRNNSLQLTGKKEIANLPEYWRQVLFLFEIYRSIAQNEAINGLVFDQLSSMNKWFIKNCWPLQVAHSC